MADSSRKYRSKHLQNQIDQAQRIKDAMTRAGDKIAALRNDPNAKRVKGLSFKDNAKLDKTIGSIMTGLHGEILSITESAIAKSWEISNQKNDVVVNTYLDGLNNFKGNTQGYYNPNQEALKGFINSSRDSKSLSDRVWTSVDAFRDEMEVHLGLGLANGDSAAVISQRIKQYLNNPEALFRMVRNEAGKLGLSKNAQQFHPGQGVYRSSYKNALRVSRSETNMAYLESDHLRWKSMDFVIGVKIELSAQHPVTDICDSMAGNYPKDYKFIGWHSQCLCHATPILMPQSDFIKYLQGEAVEVNEIVDVPQGHKDWLEANKTRIEGWKSKPYFITDNYKNGDFSKGFSFNQVSFDKGNKSNNPKSQPLQNTNSGKAKTIQEAESILIDNGVSIINSKGLSIETMNSIIDAIKVVPKSAIPDYIGSSSTFKHIFGREIGRKVDTFYGASISDFGGKFLPETIKINKFNQTIKTLGGNVVINDDVHMVFMSSGYRRPIDITAKKEMYNEMFKKKTGLRAFLNTTGESTPIHEMGHVYSNRHYGIESLFEPIQQRWFAETRIASIMTPSEGFAEAFADYFGNNGAQLPDYVKIFFETKIK